MYVKRPIRLGTKAMEAELLPVSGGGSGYYPPATTAAPVPVYSPQASAIYQVVPGNIYPVGYSAVSPYQRPPAIAAAASSTNFFDTLPSWAKYVGVGVAGIVVMKTLKRK